MTEVLDTRILNLQTKLSYQFSDEILTPAETGYFDYLLNRKAKIQSQLVKTLWRYKVEEADNCSCLTEEQVCDILNFLDNQIKTPYLPPETPATTTFNDEDLSFIFNLSSMGCEGACVSDYRNIRITLYTFNRELDKYTLGGGTITVLDKNSLSITLPQSIIETINNDTLYVRFEVMETEGVWETVVEDHVLTIIKNG